MQTIRTQVVGDVWSYAQQFKEQLAQTNPDESLAIDLNYEGVSMKAIGMIDLLDEHCRITGRDPATITVINNPNSTEDTGYQNNRTGISHFFEKSLAYWSDIKPLIKDPKTFGYFIGRKTISRSAIMYDIWNRYQNHFLLSAMKYNDTAPWIIDPGTVALEHFGDWVSADQTDNFKIWFNHLPVDSIDGHQVEDQYVSSPTTNCDLLKYYDRFRIELVAETFTLGHTFFPTEKTVRPIQAAKPIIVYGPKNFLNNLRVLGFKTYHTCWDESYDQLEGPARWQAIQKILDWVIGNNSWIDSANNIANYNRNHLRTISSNRLR